MKLLLQAFAGLGFLVAVLAAALFGSAGSFDYWQAWGFLGVFTLAVTAITLDLARRDPALLARRVKAGPVAEPSGRQKLIQSLASLAFLAVFVVSGLDRRFGWSHVSKLLAVAGEGVVLFGSFVVFKTFRANTYTSALIEVTAGQRVTSTGPYALVRHPMYAGALCMLLGVPPALGSLWAFFAVGALAAVVVARLLDEERVLAADLPGYRAYRGKVRHRLIPGVW